MLNHLVDALATFRVTRLIVDDSITKPVRDRVVADLEAAGHPKLAELIECPWCTGMWVALGVVAARRVAPKAWGPVARALAFSAVAGLLAER